MSIFESIILGLIQGLTEFLPVSSSGHLTLGKAIFGIETSDLSFEIIVHAATVLSTIVVFRKEIWELLSGFFKFKYNKETDYLFKIAVSMIPVGIVGVFFKDYVEKIFGSGILVVGIMLLLTAFLLFISERISVKAAAKSGDITYGKAFIIGIAQACAVLPGLSRSGSTIATGLMLGVRKEDIAKFSFLMVLVPILGEAFLELIGGNFSAAQTGISAGALICGGISAFVSGFIACKWMISIVKRAKLWIFSVYCLIVGVVSIVLSLI